MTLKHFLRAADEHSFALSAYCFMPDHVHALMLGRSADSDFGKCVRLIKQLSSHDFFKLTGRRLWKASYWDNTLRANGKTVDVIRYIVTNPVKAGLVSNALDYPFWGSAVYTREELLNLVVTGGSPDL
jgi:REP-associated tyrosine transposase